MDIGNILNRNRTLAGIVFSNVLNIFLAFIWKYSFMTVFWVYYIQGIVLTIFISVSFLYVGKQSKNITGGAFLAIIAFAIGIFPYLISFFFIIGTDLIAVAKEYQTQIIISSLIFFISNILWFYERVITKYNQFIGEMKKAKNITLYIATPLYRSFPIGIVALFLPLLTTRILPETPAVILFMILAMYIEIRVHRMKKDI